MDTVVTADTDDIESGGPAQRRTRRRGERGTALVELTLIVPLLMVLAVATVDFGRAWFVKNILEQAAREGVRLLAVSSPADGVTARVRQVAGAAGVPITNVSVAGPDQARRVHVAVTGSFNWIFPGIFHLFGANVTNPTPIKGEAGMRNEGAN